ncbi:hypothetical protein [Brachybacterium hainanense]|uniref:Uncharacterized protein n=1 Tax=Brachybacterium hainanense TaxID=1541174 RepID=A0ABV6R970_9MICO
MTRRTIYPAWFDKTRVIEAEQWAKAPTVATQILEQVEAHDGDLPDPARVHGWRWLLARPLYRLGDMILGAGSPTILRLAEIGVAIVEAGPDPAFPRDELVADLQERLVQQDEELDSFSQQLAKTQNAAAAGRNLARALRRVDATIDEMGHDR